MPFLIHLGRRISACSLHYGEKLNLLTGSHDHGTTATLGNLHGY